MKKYAIKITILYLVLGSIWILTTDRIVPPSFISKDLFDSIKGILFIFITTKIISRLLTKNSTMIKKLLITCFLIPLLIFSNNSFAQETNSNEDYSASLPQVRAINNYLVHMPQAGSILTKEGLAAAREGIPKNTVQPPPGVKYIQGPSGNIGLRIFKPDTIRAVVMDIHGGGWYLGAAANDDVLNDYIEKKCKVAVVSVDYRLAPENPFPDCINDCKAAAKWLVNNAMKEFGTDKIFI